MYIYIYKCIYMDIWKEVTEKCHSHVFQSLKQRHLRPRMFLAPSADLLTSKPGTITHSAQTTILPNHKTLGLSSSKIKE